MRGKQEEIDYTADRERITPADAGKTNAETKEQIEYEDHPRGCGENQTTTGAEVWWMGSPPRMRGKHQTRGRRHSVYRITPADAGKTYTSNR